MDNIDKIKIGDTTYTFGQGDIETITNNNATAIKFPDGTMICHGHVTHTGSSTYCSVTFPEAFIDTNYSISGMPLYNQYADVTIVCSYLKTNGISFFPYSGGKQITVNQKIYYIAIGRWK